MKTYEATFKEDSDGVFAISLVNDPATQETFIALAKQQEIKLAEVDKEQKILMGLVLQPDQLIYRNQGGEEFNIVFSADTIKELSHNFLKSGYQLNSKLEHEEPIKGISFVESWIVENPKVDKSTNFGMEYPKGSWMATMKCSDEVWENYVKTGKVQGFSVDAMVDLKEVNLKSNIKMAEEKLSFSEQVNEVLVSLGIVKEKEEIKFGSVMAGDVTIQFEGESLEIGAAVYVMQEDEKIMLPDGEYPLDDGRVLVAVDGKAESVGEAPAEEPEQEVAAAEPSTVPSIDDIKSAIKSVMIKYNEDVNAKLETFNESLVALKSENEKLKNEVVELSNQPIGTTIKTEVRQVELTKQGRILQSLRNNK